MIKALLFDFSRVLLFPLDSDVSSLNEKYRELLEEDNFKFFEHFKLNEELLDVIYRLQDDFEMYLFTSETIQEAPELQEDLEIFERIFSGSRMNLDKQAATSYEEIARQLAIEPEEIVFIDDSMLNLLAAKEAGCQVILYKNNEQLFDSLKLMSINP